MDRRRRDTDSIIQRILFDGHPNVQQLNPIHGRTGGMLRIGLEGEIGAVAAARSVHDLGDHGSASVFEEMGARHGVELV